MRAITVFVLSYFFIGMGFASMGGNSEFMFYGVVIVLIISLVAALDRRVGFSQVVLWGLALWGLLHLAGGLMPIPASITEPNDTNVLYNMRLQPWLPKYDQMVHAFGFGMATIAAYESLCAHLQKKLPINAAIGIAIILIGMGLGAVNEVVEFFAVLIMPKTNVGGYINTGWDLVSNLTGCVLATGWLRCRKQH